MNDKDIIDNECWEVVGATHDDKYHDEGYHGHLSLTVLLGGTPLTSGLNLGLGGAAEDFGSGRGGCLLGNGCLLGAGNR